MSVINFSQKQATTSLTSGAEMDAALVQYGANGLQLGDGTPIPQAFVKQDMLVGTIMTVAGDAIPVGTLECNGAQVSRTTYAALFAEIGLTHGAPYGFYGYRNFRLPDLRDMFIRGKSAARAVGSWQADSFKAHGHDYTKPLYLNEKIEHSSNYFRVRSHTSEIGKSVATGGTETRPQNIALRFCIVY